MQRDARAKDVAAWLSRAQLDLRAAEVDLAASPPLLADAAFHCQQAVEKALKALLTHYDHLFRRTHDIGELALACLQHAPSLEPLLREAAPLTEYAWRFRYPGEVFEPDRREVEDALQLAHRVVADVRTAVGQMPV
jgi:HEPN domain-containing protein